MFPAGSQKVGFVLSAKAMVRLFWRICIYSQLFELPPISGCAEFVNTEYGLELTKADVGLGAVSSC